MAKNKYMRFYFWKRNKFKNLIINSNKYDFPIKIKLVVCNNKNAEGLKFAKKWSIPYLIFKNNKFLSGKKMLKSLRNYKINLILLAGFMKILSKRFIRSFWKIYFKYSSITFTKI